jgi:hypothetical protein
MAYIGAVAPGYDPTRASVPQLDAERFSGNASTTAFTLTRQVVSPTDINVIVENVLQEPTVAYSVNGYTLNFTEAPSTGTNNIYVIYRASAVSNYAFVPDGSITYAKLANNIKQFTVDNFTANGTGSTVALTEAPASANAVIVSVDGVIQTAPTNYTLSGSTITFTGVPDNGANVVVKHIGFRTTSTVTALQASSVTSTELADGSVTNAKIVSVANTKISGNIVSSQITSVANTQITGNIISSQITSVANTQITGNIASSQITSNPTLYGNVSVTGVIGVGGATPSTSGSGITFPASQSASSDANTLDDYEEGTYTPVVTGSTTGGPFTFGTQSGYYTKIGREVKVSMFMSHNSTVTFTGAYKISLPFTVADYAGGGFVSYIANWISNSPVMFQVEAGNTFGFLRMKTSANPEQMFDLNSGLIQNNTSYMLTIIYKTT